jgi:hypothetical protein
MHFQIPDFRPPTAQPPAVVRVVARQDVVWNRWVFKAPSLIVQPHPVNPAPLFTDQPRHLARVAS